FGISRPRRASRCKIFARAWAWLFFVFKQKTAYDIGLGIPAEPLFRSRISLRGRSAASFAASWLLNALLRIFAMSIITPKRKVLRSEERRVGKECRSRWTADHSKKNAESQDRTGSAKTRVTE